MIAGSSIETAPENQRSCIELTVATDPFPRVSFFHN
jgi:hypothetical protein